MAETTDRTGTTFVEKPVTINTYPAQGDPTIRATPSVAALGSSINTLLQDASTAQKTILQANHELQPNTGGLFSSLVSGIASLPTWGKLTLLGGAILAVWGIIAAIHGGESKSSTSPTTLTSLQASQAAQILQSQLARSDQQLLKQGVSASAVASSHHEVQIVDGTQIVMSARAPDALPAAPQHMTVSGPATPSHYENLTQVDAAKYVSTLSASPDLNALTEHSAVIHGVQANSQ